MRAVLYLRLSAMADDSTSIVRQERDLRERAERSGWDVVAVLADEGISGRKARERAEEAVRMIEDGEADVLAVWKLDRFTRQGWDGLGRLSRALDARARTERPALFVALQDGLDSTQGAFRMIAGVLSEVARTEAENGAARSRAAMHYRRTVADRWAGGSTVPFGYRSVPAPDGVGRVLVLDETEAAIVREGADRLLGTERATALARDLQRREIPTSKSPVRRAARRGEPTEGLDRGRWTATTVLALWTADTLLGRQTHRGDLVRDVDGLPRSVWPPILDLPTLQALRGRLRPAVPGVQRRRQARVLSGLAYCAVCDSKLYVTTSGSRPLYACGSSWNGGECPSPKVDAEHLEDYVSSLFLRLAGALPHLVPVAIEDAQAARVAEVDAAIRETAEEMTRPGADVAALASRISTLHAQAAELRAAPSAPRATMRDTGLTIAEAWRRDELDISARRDLLLAAMDHLTVAPTERRGSFDPDRVEIRWQG